MLDLGWTELLVIAVVAILVVGPKDLPRMLRTVGQFMGKMRSMAREFQRQFEDAARDTGLDDIRKGVSTVKDISSPTKHVKDAFKSIAEETDNIKKSVEAPETVSADASAAKKPAASSGTGQGSKSQAATSKKAAPKKTAAAAKKSNGATTGGGAKKTATPRKRSGSKTAAADT